MFPLLRRCKRSWKSTHLSPLTLLPSVSRDYMEAGFHSTGWSKGFTTYLVFERMPQRDTRGLVFLGNGCRTAYTFARYPKIFALFYLFTHSRALSCYVIDLSDKKGQSEVCGWVWKVEKGHCLFCPTSSRANLPSTQYAHVYKVDWVWMLSLVSR